MATAGKLEYIISIDSSQVNSGLSKAEGSVKGFGNKLSTWAIAKGHLLGSLIERAGRATVSFVKNSIQESASFDKSMAQVAATLGKSTKEIKQLSDFARKMGQDTAFTAQEAAQGLNYMALAGYDAQTSMKMLPTVLNLAAAGAMDLANASDMVTDAQSALGLSISETEVMVDQMAKTSSKTNTSVEQLGQAFLTVGGTAKRLKGGTQELSALLGVLANNGIKGAEGGTALRNVLNGLSNPAGKAAKQLKKLGVEAYDADGNLRSMPDILTDMNKALGDKTMKERTEIFAKAFNVRDLKSIEALLSMTADDWKTLMREIGNSNGAAAKMAETQLDNLAGDATKFKSALGEAKIALVEGLTPALRKFVQSGTNLVKRITEAFKRKGLKGAIEEVGKVFSNFIQNLKDSDSPVLQKVGSALEFVKDVGKEVWGLITDFPGKLKEWKESDSPGLNALANVLDIIKVAGETIVDLFNGGDLTDAIAKLRDIDTPLSDLAAGGLSILKDFCEFVSGRSDLGGIIESIAKGFLLFKGLQISSSLLGFIANLTKLGGMSVSGTGLGLLKLLPSLAFGYTLFKNAFTPQGNDDLVDENGNKTEVGEWAETVGTVDNRTEEGKAYDQGVAEQAKKVKEINLTTDLKKNVLTKPFVELGENAIRFWNKFWKGQQEGEKAAVEAQEKEQAELSKDQKLNLKDFADWIVGDEFSIEEQLQAVRDFLQGADVELPLEPDSSQVDAAVAGMNYSTTVTLIPKYPGGYLPGFTGGGGAGAPSKNGYVAYNAKGNWNVPYDNYPTLLHRGEMVLTKSQARQLRDGNGGGSSVGEMVSASVEKAMSKVYVMLNGNKVGDLTSKRVKNNINASTYNKLRAMGG